MSNIKHTAKYNGEIKSLIDIAKESGVPYVTVYERHQRGLSDLISKSIRAKAVKKFSFFEGELLGLKEISRRTGKHYQTLNHRHKKNKPLMETDLIRLNINGKDTTPKEVSIKYLVPLRTVYYWIHGGLIEKKLKNLQESAAHEN